MNEAVAPSIENPMPAPNVDGPLTSGAMLKLARQASGLHIAALAVSLKVPVSKLEALEADRFDLLPDTVFVRALARSVCRSLKIDPDPILEKLPHSIAPQFKAYASGFNVPFQSPGGPSHGLLRAQLAKPLVWVVSALLAGALALFFFPFERPADVVVNTKSVATAVTSTPPLATPVPASPGNEAAGLAPALPTATGAVESAEPVAGSGALNGIVVFRARAQSWVEVVDGSGAVQVRRNIAAGETVGVSGALPLTVVVGRSDSTEVEVHGKPFDLSPVAKDNVARFEVR